MAITNNGTQNLINAKQLPTNYSRPTVSTFANDEYTSTELVLTIDKSTVENATNSVTMDNIITEITSQVDAILANDYVNTNTVDAYTDLNQLTNNYADLNGDSSWLGTTIPKYICSVKIYIKVA